MFRKPDVEKAYARFDDDPLFKQAVEYTAVIVSRSYFNGAGVVKLAELYLEREPEKLGELANIMDETLETICAAGYFNQGDVIQIGRIFDRTSASAAQLKAALLSVAAHAGGAYNITDIGKAAEKLKEREYKTVGGLAKAILRQLPR